MRLQIAALLAVSFLSFAQAADVIKIKFSHVVAPDTPKGLAALKFKELAEKRSNGRVKVDIYPNSQLYKDKEEIEALQLGAVQIVAPSLSKFGPLGTREFEVFDMPYIFPNNAALYRVIDGEVGKKMFAKLESRAYTAWPIGTTATSNYTPTNPFLSSRTSRAKNCASNLLKS